MLKSVTLFTEPGSDAAKTFTVYPEGSAGAGGGILLGQCGWQAVRVPVKGGGDPCPGHQGGCTAGGSVSQAVLATLAQGKRWKC